MLSLITNANHPVSVEIDGKEYKAKLFSMLDWGELLSRLRSKRVAEVKEAVEGLGKDLAKEMLQEALSANYFIEDGYNYAHTPVGMVDVFHIAIGEQLSKKKIGSIFVQDGTEVGKLIIHILALPISENIEEEDEDDDDAKKK